MGASGTTRFRVVVLLLLFLIIWQVYKLYPSDSSPDDKDEKTHEILIPDKVVEVSVFYEALCPDSKHFFVHHLDTTYNKLKEHLSLKLIPYGKAKTFYNPNGMLDFECQHGEIECQANKIHACTIELISDTKQHLELVNCMIKDNMDPEQALSRCGSLLSVDITTISECAKGSQGSELLKKHGDVTHILKPTFIPTVLVDGSRDNQAGLLKNFLLEVCKHFKDFRIPPGCA